MLYVPPAADVAVALMVPARTAWTVAPDTAEPPVVRVIEPDIVPVVTTVNVTPLLAFPATVMTTGPVAAPEGTGTPMLVGPQLDGVAVVPLNVTLLVP